MVRFGFAALAGAALLLAPPAFAQPSAYSDGVIPIGVLNDSAGPTSEATGKGSVVAAQLAAEDFGGAINGVPIEIVVGDHQNKPDVGVAIVRRAAAEDRNDTNVQGMKAATAAIRGVVREAAGFEEPVRRRIELAVIDATDERVAFERAWYLPLGFDPAPNEVEPVADLLAKIDAG